jgi:hypothetical protein
MSSTLKTYFSIFAPKNQNESFLVNTTEAFYSYWSLSCSGCYKRSFADPIPPYVNVRFLSPPTKSMIWRVVAIRPLSNKYVFESKYVHIYSNTLLNIAQTTQYCTFVVYQTSFSRDSRQEVVWLYWLSRNMEEVC